MSVAGASDYAALRSSGLYEELVDASLLVPHDEVDLDSAADHSARWVLAPQMLPFVSYPSEWPHALLREAALAVLRIQRMALMRGMSLKDAPGRNIQFKRGRAVLVDTLSLECYREGEPWIAYRQFCEHFLAPLLISSRIDADIARTLNLNGVPLERMRRLVPLRHRMRRGLFLHLTVHSMLSARLTTRDAADRAISQRVSRTALLGLVDSLERAVLALESPAGGKSNWASYPEENSYSPNARSAKELAIAGALDLLRPTSVWDLGANTGTFGRLAAARAIDTVLMDGDGRTVERCTRESWRPGVPLLPLVVDLLHPPAATGWANAETRTLEQRGPADLILALALVHHLAIAGGVPLERIVEWLCRLGRHVAIEWVPSTDPMVQVLSASRRGTHPYERSSLQSAIDRCASVLRVLPLSESGRELWLLRSRAF